MQKTTELLPIVKVHIAQEVELQSVNFQHAKKYSLVDPYAGHVLCKY